MLSLFTCSEVPFHPTSSAPSPLPTSLLLPSPMPYNSPSSPQLPLSLPQPFSTPLLNYHQSASITNPPLNYKCHCHSSLPPGQTNNNITLSPSLIYQLSLQVGITDPCQYNSCNCHYRIADITLLPPPQCISNLIT